MAQSTITVSRLSKQYRLDLGDEHDTLRDLISDIPKRILEKRFKKRKEKFWALKNVSFKVNQGEVLGLIGRNGAGKTTLLKILARIIPPTKGSATIRGRTASILGVGTGFHVELTGRENVFLSGAVLGMKRAEIKKKFNDIVDFSGVSKFLDMPVKRYSSGMQVRLAFAVAAHLDPEILLIDEVLAVGDLAFRKKSLAKMHSIAKDEGRTVVFVSHSMPAIDSLCNRALLLEEGKVKAYGKTREVISKYIRYYVPEETVSLAKSKLRTGNGKIRIVDFWLEDVNRKRTNSLKSGDKCYFVFKFISPSGLPQKDVDFGFAVKNQMEQSLFLHYLSYTNQEIKKCPPEGKFIFEFKKLPLTKGKYHLGLRLLVENREADYVPSAAQFIVSEGDFYKTGVPIEQQHSPVYVEGSWKINN